MINLNIIEPPQVGIRMEEQNTLAYINNDCKGQGILYIAESEIVWVSNSNEGFSLKYPDISLFAVCLDQQKYPENCIYMLVADENPEENDDSSDDEGEKEVEIRFAPPDGTSIHDMFNCIQDCNKLHITSDVSDDNSNEESDMDMEDGNYDDYDGFNSNIVYNANDDVKNMNGQFDDAD